MTGLQSFQTEIREDGLKTKIHVEEQQGKPRWLRVGI